MTTAAELREQDRRDRVDQAKRDADKYRKKGSSVNRSPNDDGTALSTGIVWEKPPPGGRGKTAEWINALYRLVEVAKEPGQWARVATCNSSASASSVRKNLQAFAEMHDQANLWEPFRSAALPTTRDRGVDDKPKHGVWACFVADGTRGDA